MVFYKPSGRDQDDYRTGLNVRPDQNQKLMVATQCLKASRSIKKINLSSFSKIKEKDNAR